MPSYKTSIKQMKALAKASMKEKEVEFKAFKDVRKQNQLAQEDVRKRILESHKIDTQMARLNKSK